MLFSLLAPPPVNVRLKCKFLFDSQLFCFTRIGIRFTSAFEREESSQSAV